MSGLMNAIVATAVEQRSLLYCLKLASTPAESGSFSPDGAKR